MYPRVSSRELAWILSWEARQPLLQCAYGSFGQLFARHGKLYVNITKTQIWTLLCFATLTIGLQVMHYKLVSKVDQAVPKEFEELV